MTASGPGTPGEGDGRQETPDHLSACKPEFILSCSDKDDNKYLVTNTMLENFWILLSDCLSSLDSSTSLLEKATELAAHFYDMYVEWHTGKHLTGDRI